MASSSRTVVKCEQCGDDQSKYCCPRCGIRTCSLGCVSRHKQEEHCDGIRDRTKYVPLAKMDDLTLLSDYRLLEETGRCVDNSLRYPLKRSMGHLYHPLPYYLHRLVKVCRSRGTRLLILPSNFQRRKDNSTWFNVKTHLMSWRVELSFLQADVRYFIDNVSEESTLGDALLPYMSPDLCQPDDRASLQFYHSASFRGVVPLMKVEQIQSKDPKYVTLNFSKSLRSNLKGITVIEFPTILLVLQDHVHGFSLLKDDPPVPCQTNAAADGDSSDDSDQAPVENFLIRQPTQQQKDAGLFLDPESSSADRRQHAPERVSPKLQFF